MTTRWLLLLIAVLVAAPAFARADGLRRIETRPGVTTSFYYMKRHGATASLVLLSGGSGGIGMNDRVPTSPNFLVRSRDLFAAKGFNVAVVGRPSDRKDLDGSFRLSGEHVEDIRGIIGFLKKDAGVPVWVVGTSLGTITATAVAAASDASEVAGVVLTASVTRNKVGAVPDQKLGSIAVPVLILHHQLDECRICVPGDLSDILSGLSRAPVKKKVLVTSGDHPRGDVCGALHWHGFIGMEQEAVDVITSWIKNPVP